MLGAGIGVGFREFVTIRPRVTQPAVKLFCGGCIHHTGREVPLGYERLLCVLFCVVAECSEHKAVVHLLVEVLDYSIFLYCTCRYVLCRPRGDGDPVG